MKLRKDRGNFSNLVSESLRVPASLRYNCFYPNSFMQLLSTPLSLSLPLSANRVILCSKQQDIGSIDAPYLLQKIFPKGEQGDWVLYGRYTNSGQYLFPRAYSQKTSRIWHLWRRCFRPERPEYHIAQMINRYHSWTLYTDFTKASR